MLDSSTQQWLINNNGDVVPSSVLHRITAVAGEPTADAPRIGDNIPEGLSLSDEVADWIEKTANEEVSEDKYLIRVGTNNRMSLPVQHRAWLDASSTDKFHRIGGSLSDEDKGPARNRTAAAAFI